MSNLFRFTVGGGVSLPPPVFVTSATEITVNTTLPSTPVEEDVVISNGGSGGFGGLGTITVSLVSPAAWCIPSYASGVLTVAFDVSALTANNYSATVRIESNVPGVADADIPVYLTVLEEAPTIGLQPASLTLSVTDESVGALQSVSIVSAGTAPLATPTLGTIVYSGVFQNWVTGALITDDGDGSFTLSFTPTAVGGTVGGPYTATIPIVSAGASNSPLNVTVSLTVASPAPAFITLDRNLDDARSVEGVPETGTFTVGIRSGNSSPLTGPTVSAPVYSGTVQSGWCTASVVGSALTGTWDNTGLIAGSGTATFTVSDPAASNTAQFVVYLSNGVAVFPPLLSVNPTGVSVGVYNGNDAPTQVVNVSNGGSGGLAGLGTVAASFTTATAWCTPTYSNGAIDLVFDTSALANGTYSSILRVTGTLANNSPVDILVQVVVSTAPAPSAFPPDTSPTTKPEGWTYNQTVGYYEGSCFDVSGPAELAGGARPAFAGTVYNIPETYATWTAAMAAVTAGTIVPGDVISVRADQVITDAQFPPIPGYTFGTTGFICVQSRNMANLPAYSHADGPDSYGVSNRGGKLAHRQYMPVFQTLTTNRSAIHLQQGGGGFWLEGLNFFANTPARTNAVLSLRAATGTSPAQQTSEAQCFQGIVIDRCAITSGVWGHQRGITADARYVRITHSTIDLCRRIPDNATDTTTYDNTGINAILTDGHIDILGNQVETWGIHVIAGGGEPAWTNVQPNDVTVMWNAFVTPPNMTAQSDNHNFKSTFELKVGGRWIYAFNRATGMGGRADHLTAVLLKCTDQTNLVGGVCRVPQILQASHVFDITVRCNYFHGAKGFLAVTDAFDGGCGIGGAIGLERVAAHYNLSVAEYTTGLWPINKGSGYIEGVGNRKWISTARSGGDGSPVVDLDHNTMVLKDTSESHSFWEPADQNGVGATHNWRDVKCKNTILAGGRVRYGPIRTGKNTNATTLNAHFGSGNWDVQRCYVPALTASIAPWDATLLGAGHNCGYLQSSNNFVDEATGDYTLVPGHPLKGVGTDGLDPGYEHAYLTAMTSTVTPNV